MKIVQINAVYGYGSTGIIVRDIHKLSEKCKLKSYAAYQFSNENNTDIFKIGNLFDWKFHALLSHITAKQGFYSYFSTLNFLKKTDKIQPDIIHLHNLHSNYINLPLLLKYCAENKIKTILTLHDTWFFTGKCCHFLDINCDKYKQGCHNCPKKLMDYPNYFKDNSNYVWNRKKELFQNIDNLKVIGCSEWIADRAKECDIFKGKYISYIHNGIDKNIFKPKETEKENKFTVLCFANKWFEEKNKDVTDKLIEYCKNTDKIIYLVGCSENQKSVYKDQPIIKTFGYIKDRNEMADIYNKCDVFINLTLADTLPTVNMESVACGTPVICYTDCGGGPELIKENLTGYVVQKFDYNAIIESIEKISNNAINSNDCIKYATENFDKDKNYIKYIDEYINW